MMTQTVHSIINPVGGGGRGIRDWQVLKGLLAAEGLEIRELFTDRAGHARELAERVDAGPEDRLCVVGGDGTMHEVVNGMMQRKLESRVPLVIVPSGTGNSFARDLGLREVSQIPSLIRDGGVRAIDVFVVEDGDHRRFGFNIVGWGLFASANARAERLRWLGKRRYDVAGLVEVLRGRRWQGRLSMDGEVMAGAMRLVVAANTVHTGEGMRLAPDAILDDGLLELFCVSDDVGRVGLLKLFPRLFTGTHLQSSEVSYRRVESLAWSTQEAQAVNIDGEVQPCGTHVSVRVISKVLPVVFPAGFTTGWQ